MLNARVINELCERCVCVCVFLCSLFYPPLSRAQCLDLTFAHFGLDVARINSLVKVSVRGALAPLFRRCSRKSIGSGEKIPSHSRNGQTQSIRIVAFVQFHLNALFDHIREMPECVCVCVCAEYEHCPFKQISEG